MASFIDDTNMCRKLINQFCYVCGVYIQPFKTKVPINKAIENAYFAYFGIYVEQDSFLPTHCCDVCYFKLINWYDGNKELTLSFKRPMIWRPPMDHLTGCYVCATKNLNGRPTQIVYPDGTSSCKPVPSTPDCAAPSMKVRFQFD